MMVRRSHRFNGEVTPSQQVLQETHYRYAPPGRRHSAEFKSPLPLQPDSPQVTPLQSSLRTLDMPPPTNSSEEAGGCSGTSPHTLH